ncbi:nose resistant to fluoxetine protein 6-like [Diabrotica undecimpunctata]|uniref:nose resistant to fluoxetine protein 6-like n=1 Tax=Diabrotica undecimpunctata TaxID=50387 RepID=UPI003B63C331
MNNIFQILYISVIWYATRVYSNATNVKYTYNSSDLSYLSNGIQFPVDESDIEILGQDKIFSNGSQFWWFSRLYDHYKWWKRLEDLDNVSCRSDMMVYLKELVNGTSWALKMYDASGRYSGQFFFGNDYWLGSMTLCEELTNKKWNAAVPPFLVQFYIAKVRINLNHQDTPVTRQLNIGECLPKSCGTQEVLSLLTLEQNGATSMTIAGIRKVPGDYSLLSDIKVHLLGGTCLALFFIILTASVVDYSKISSDQRQNSKKLHSDNNNIANYNHGDIRNEAIDLNIEAKKEDKKKTGLLVKLLLSFSSVTNGRKILSVQHISLESIKCIHGLRFFSISWIILVHSYLELFAVSDNKNLRTLTERRFLYQTISNATFSVDTFFFISGLLVTLTYFRTATKKDSLPEPRKPLQHVIGRFFLMIIYRILRLTPAYGFILVLNEIVMRYLHSNSVFSPAIIDHISCDRYWWRNLLYINNFFPQNEFCMLWSWYMANDTQFYIIACVLLLIAVRKNSYVKLAGVAIALLMTASWITTFIIAMKWNYVARVEEPFALFDQLYDKPWLRIGPYLIGMVVGYYLFKVDCKQKFPAIVVTIGWILSLGCLGCLVYGLGREGLAVPTSAFYAALGHSAWGLSIAWITIACCSGYGGPFNSILSCKLFLPLSRLTYCAYLVHPVLMCLTSFHLDGSLHLHQAMAVVIYCGNLVISYLSAFIISLAFEAPIVNLLKIIFN